VIISQAANVIFAAKLVANGVNYALSYTPLKIEPWADDLLKAERARRDVENNGQVVQDADIKKLEKEVSKASIFVRLYFKIPSGARDMFYGLNKITTLQLIKWMIPSWLVSNLAWSATNLILGEPHPKIHEMLGVLGALNLTKGYSNPVLSPLYTWVRQKVGY
jgi:hypothetical protein